VIQRFGDVPRYQDFPTAALGDGDLRVRVEAVALENFGRMTVAGEHYASRQMFPRFPAVVGHSGVGILDDGTRVTFGGIKPPHGAMAELAVVPSMYRAFIATVPDSVDAATAAALPGAALTSLLPLKYGVNLQPGETVLINGATGVSGKLAVQIAKLLGAGRIVGTGRSGNNLASLQALGADAIIDLKAPDAEVTQAFSEEAGHGYDVVLDLLWGHPTELLLKTLIPKEAGFAKHRTRLVQIGEAAGPTIALSAEMVRTSGVELTGAGGVSPEVVPQAVAQAWEWAATSRLKMDLTRVPLRDIAEAWERGVDGSRTVIMP
jgi:NADPH2:quinone reductase